MKKWDVFVWHGLRSQEEEMVDPTRDDGDINGV